MGFQIRAGSVAVTMSFTRRTPQMGQVTAVSLRSLCISVCDSSPVEEAVVHCMVTLSIALASKPEAGAVPWY